MEKPNVQDLQYRGLKSLLGTVQRYEQDLKERQPVEVGPATFAAVGAALELAVAHAEGVAVAAAVAVETATDAFAVAQALGFE